MKIRSEFPKVICIFMSCPSDLNAAMPQASNMDRGFAREFVAQSRATLDIVVTRFSISGLPQAVDECGGKVSPFGNVAHICAKERVIE